MEGSTQKGPRSSNLDYSITASVLEGLASLWVDLHEVGGSQATPNQSRRHHPPKGNRLGNDDELLALVLQDDRLLNTQSLSHRFGLVEEIDWVESNLGRLEIKIHMVGMEWHDLNT